MTATPAPLVSGPVSGQSDLGALDWVSVLDPSGPWSALVTAGSSPARAADRAAGLVYLSLPYFPEVAVRDAWRVERSVRLALFGGVEMGRLADCGATALCPAVSMAEIAQARVLDDAAPEPLDRGFWLRWSQPVLNAAALLVIPDLPGWRDCPMVWRDLRFALTHQMPVHVYGGCDVG